MRNLLPLALDGTDPASISLTVLLTGLIVVFLVLICLTFIIYLAGAVVHKALGKKKAPAPEKNIPALAPAPVALVEAPAVEDGISEEVVAAIAAAVYCVEGAPLSAVKSIKRSRSNARSAWGMAGLIENTKPF